MVWLICTLYQSKVKRSVPDKNLSRLLDYEDTWSTFFRMVFLTCSLSIELKPHGDVPKPRVRFDFHEAGVNARSQRMCNNAVTIVVGRENLEKRMFM